MIKLKDIIFEVMDKWISPSGTPSEVIDVTHKIFKVVQRDAPSYDVNHWVKIYGPVPDSDEEDVVWAIDKPSSGSATTSRDAGTSIPASPRSWSW